MKVITIKQPWATLIAKGYKEYEFRTWKTKYRGDVLIHAGKSFDKSALKRFEDYNLEYPTGAIIARATITDCLEVNDEFRKMVYPLEKNVYASLKNPDHGGYAFKMENIKEIKPIYMNGKLSLWDYDRTENIEYIN